VISNRLRPAVLAGVAFTLAAAALAGCASGSAPAAGSAATPKPGAAQGYTTPRTMPAGKGSGAADGVFPRTVAHFQGETTLPSEPKKVVVISTGQADALLSLGIVPAGSTAGDGAAMIPPYLYAAFPGQKQALDGVKYVGNRFAPDLESIANIKPDLIVMNNAGKDAKALYTGLSALAQGTGLYWKQDFLLLADAVGKADQAQKWLADYHAEAAAIGQRVQDTPTVSFLRRNAGRTRIFGIASFSGSVAEDCAIARPASQQFTDDTSKDISGEQLDQVDAGWIFYGVQGGKAAELTSLALWPTLTAVTENHAVAVDDDVFYLNVGPAAARRVLTVLEHTLAP